MPKFVELWIYLSATPLFGLSATLVVYLAAHALYTRSGHAPWANPVLWSVVVLACALLATGVSYPTYFAGAQFIHFLLGPAVVALGWPLCRRCCINPLAHPAEQAGALVGCVLLPRTCQKTRASPASPKASTGSRTGPSTTRA